MNDNPVASSDFVVEPTAYVHQIIVGRRAKNARPSIAADPCQIVHSTPTEQ